MDDNRDGNADPDTRGVLGGLGGLGISFEGQRDEDDFLEDSIEDSVALNKDSRSAASKKSRDSKIRTRPPPLNFSEASPVLEPADRDHTAANAFHSRPAASFPASDSIQPRKTTPARREIQTSPRQAPAAGPSSHAVSIKPLGPPDFEPISAFDLIRRGYEQADNGLFSQGSIDDDRDEEEVLRPQKGPAKNTKRARFAGSSQNQIIEFEPPSSSASSVQGAGDVFARNRESSTSPALDAIQEADAEDGVVMCLLYRKRRLGVASYSAATRVLSVLPECDETESFEISSHVVSQLRPSRILTSSRCDEPFIEHLRPLVRNLDIRPSSEFGHQNSLNRLLSTKIIARDGEYNVPDRREAEAWISARIGLGAGNTESVIAAGSLLAQLHRSSVGMQEPSYRRKRGRKIIAEDDEEEQRDEVEEIVLDGIEEMSIEAHLQISEETLRALSIFLSDKHPWMHSRAHKEGLSLFGVLDTTLTPLGRRLLRTWLLRPSADPKILQTRHEAVALFVRPENEGVISQVRNCLKNVTNIHKVVQSLRVQPTIADFQNLLKFSYFSIKIRSYLRELPRAAGVEIIFKIHALFDASTLREIGSLINEVCDFDQTAEEGRFVVKAGVDPELDGMKRTYEGLNDLLTDVAREVAETVEVPDVSKLNCIYFPQLGFLVTIPLQPDWKTATDFEVAGLQYQFCTANTVYYKSDKMRELDTVLGDIHGLISDREIEIMHQLSEKILEYGTMLVKTCDLTAELDCLLSLASAARRYNYVRPTMTEANVLHVRKGRHPLAELVSETFVTNDIRFDDLKADQDGTTRIMMLSGANCSGKSTYLKEAALIVFMAHIGSFVPAESAVVGYTDRILSRIQTKETVSKAESAFTHDLIQVNLALANATPRSIVLLDEFGKGTATSDGIALLCGTLEHFADRAERCPKVLCATHFHEIFTNSLLVDTPLINYFVMEVLQAPGTRSLTFLYRVIEGKTTQSFGNYVAALAGIPQDVVDRAEEVSLSFSRFEPVDTRVTKQDERKYQLAEAVVDAFSELDLDETPWEEIEDFLDRVCDEADRLKV